jgi:hypothetical protein
LIIRRRRSRSARFPAHLGEQLHLLLQHLVDALAGVLCGVAQPYLGRSGQGRSGSALRGLATPGQIGLGDGLRLDGGLVGAGIDQNHFQRRVGQHPLEGLRVHEAQGQDAGMHGQGQTQRHLQGRDPGCSHHHVG